MPCQHAPGNSTGRISLSNGFLSVAILPEAGGNISELTDVRSGRNWLWNNPHIPISDERQGSDYGRELDSGGWDEILLSITPDQLGLPGLGSRRIPDHGDLVRKRWTVMDHADRKTSCTLGVFGEILRYRFSRTIALSDDAPRITISYELVNEEVFSWPWFWCAHALLDVVPDTRIHLPDALCVRVESETGKLNPAKRMRTWPILDEHPGHTVDLSNSFAANGPHFCGKVFVETPHDNEVVIQSPANVSATNHESLTLRLDRKILPWLGLWINNHGWSGCDSEPYRNLGLEPATTPYDSVVEAVRNDAVEWIEPGEKRNWALQLDLAA